LAGQISLAFRGTATASSTNASFAPANLTIRYQTNVALVAEWRALCASDTSFVFSTAAGDAAAALTIALPAPAAITAVQLWRGIDEPAWPAVIDVRVLPSAASLRSAYAPCYSSLNGTEAESMAGACVGAGAALAVTARGGGQLHLCALFVYGRFLAPPPPLVLEPPPPPSAHALSPASKPFAWYWIVLIVVVGGVLCACVVHEAAWKAIAQRRAEQARAAAMRAAVWKEMELRAIPSAPLPPSLTCVPSICESPCFR